MNWSTIRPLVAKDLKLFYRNRFFAFISIMGLIAYAAIYLAMPRSVDEMLSLGLYSPVLPDQIAQVLEEEDGEPLMIAESEDALQSAVLSGEISAGIALPEDIFEQLTAGGRPVVTIYLPSDAPDDLRDLMAVLVEAMVLALSDTPLNIEVREETLGPDLVGQQIPLRDRMLPLFAIFVLMMETLGLASLIAQEVQTRTIQALLVTPMGVGELITSKTVISVLMTFTQAALLMLIIGGFRQQPLIIAVTLLLGALLVTGIGFLMGAVGKDFLSVIGSGIPVIILLSIPAFGIAFPGLLTGWARLIPSHYLADTIHQVANFGAGWGQVWTNLVILLVVDVVLLWLGASVLQRKFR
jgi:ABC-2 type transport system permease protein